MIEIIIKISIHFSYFIFIIINKYERTGNYHKQKLSVPENID